MQADSPEERKLLSPELLETLRSRWDASGSPISEHLNPGLDDGQIDALMATNGLNLGPEMKLWWRWQNGNNPAMGRGVSCAPGLYLVSLEDALERYQMVRNVARDTAAAWEETPEFLWNPEWFPILRGENLSVAGSCVKAGQSGSPVFIVDWPNMAPKEWQAMRLPSMGDMVQMWIDCMDAGFWKYEPATGFWRHETWEEMPERMRATSLV